MFWARGVEESIWKTSSTLNDGLLVKTREDDDSTCSCLKTSHCLRRASWAQH